MSTSADEKRAALKALADGLEDLAQQRSSAWSTISRCTEELERGWERMRVLIAELEVFESRQQRDTAAGRREPVDRFLRDCCEIRADATTPTAQIHDTYASWARRQNIEPMTPHRMTKELHKRGVQSARSNGVRLYRGVGVPVSKESNRLGT